MPRQSDIRSSYLKKGGWQETSPFFVDPAEHSAFWVIQLLRGQDEVGSSVVSRKSTLGHVNILLQVVKYVHNGPLKGVMWSELAEIWST